MSAGRLRAASRGVPGRRWVLAWLPLCLLTAAARQVPHSRLPSYVGEAACLECHAPGGAADACTLESIPAHHAAFDALSKDEAPHIAVLTGTTEAPQQSLLCLGCHATSAELGALWTTPSF